MKWFVIISCFLCLPAFSQKVKIDFSEIDRSVQFADATAPSELAQQLTANYTSDLQKVRAIFRWIADNISYRTSNPIGSRKKRYQNIYDEADDDDTSFLKPLDERVAEIVLQNKMGVCEGYARLFKTLCNFAGIKAEVINGYGKTAPHQPRQRFRVNHSWNAVLIDSVWQLLDVTWAAGYITWQGDRFVRQLDEQYFLSPPEVFIREHYPDDLRWSLMDDPPLMSEFRVSPFRQKSFTKYNIKSFKPSGGVIEANMGDTIQIEVESDNVHKDRNISSDPFFDISLYSTNINALLMPSSGVILPKTVYTYPVTSPDIQWLYVLYNDDVILRYKLVVKSKGRDTAKKQ
jgi:transglutaminase/protease-like cytokinesis protein 3